MDDIKKLQNKLLEVALYLDEFCKQNKIEYFLAEGTLLGAIRHKGFIPWDDDFDIFMTYDNYVKFVECAKNNLDTQKYYLQEENTQEWPLFITKVRMNGTTFIEEDTKDRIMHKGVYIDIFCLNNVSNNCIYRFTQYLSAKILIAKSLQERGYKTNSVIKKLTMFSTRLIISKKLKNLLLRIVRSNNGEKTNYIGHLFGRTTYKNSIYSSDIFTSIRHIEFENKVLPVPILSEKFLTVRYGDYMKIPDESTRSNYPIHALKWDTEKDYKDYEKEGV